MDGIEVDAGIEPDLELGQISRRAVSGVVVLTLRKFGLKAISYLGSILLARLLTPDIFGVFAIVSFIITFFSFFSDVGLGAALIQQKEPITKKELAATFGLQQVLVLIVVGAIFGFAPLLAGRYDLGSDGVWLIRIFSLSLFLTSLKTIPSILLERQLKFNKLIIPEVIEVVSFQILVVGLAYLGFGVWSFIISLLVRSLLGVASLYVISPWRPELAWDSRIAKKLVSFGIPYNLNGFISTIKDAVLPIFVGAVSGAAAVGYLNWALTFSKLPILFMSDVFRVTFPTYARIQGNKEVLKRAIEKTVRFTNLFLFPAVFLLAATAKPIVTIIFTDKWLPALPAFYIHLTGILIVGITNTFMDVFWALGRTKAAVNFLILFTAVNWLSSVPLVYRYGFNGAMIGSVVVLYVSLPLTWWYMNRIVKVSVVSQIWPAFLAGAAAGAAAWQMSAWATDLVKLLAVLAVSGLAYLLTLLVIDGKRMAGDWRWLRQNLKV